MSQFSQYRGKGHGVGAGRLAGLGHNEVSHRKKRLGCVDVSAKAPRFLAN